MLIDRSHDSADSPTAEKAVPASSPDATPALQTMPSMRPKAARAVAMAACTPSRVETSAAMGRARKDCDSAAASAAAAARNGGTTSMRATPAAPR